MNAGAIHPQGSVEHLVRPADSAAEWGNDLPVLATPVLLWLAEIACMRAMSDALDADEMTVGIGHDSEHLAPTPVGDSVRVTAQLRSVDGRRVSFDVSARDGRDVVFSGRHTRAVVARSRFVARVAALTANGGGP